MFCCRWAGNLGMINERVSPREIEMERPTAACTKCSVVSSRARLGEIFILNVTRHASCVMQLLQPVNYEMSR